MHRRSPLVLAALATSLAIAPAAHAANVPLLPAVARGLDAADRTKTICATAPATGRGLDSATYKAPMSGFVTVRLRGTGDWDLRVRDAASRRSLGASQGFGGTELVQTWVTAGQKLVADGCRRKGAGRTARVSFTLADVKPPSAPAGAPMLVRVHGDGKQIQALEERGFDVTHNQRPGWADVVILGSDQLAELRETGLPFDVRIADLRKSFAKSRAADAAYTKRVGKLGSPLPSGRTEYRSYEDFQADLKKLVDEHPDRVRPVVIGKTFQGREITGVEIAKDVNANDGRPVYFLMGEHHAREWPSGEAAMEFAAMMATQADDPRIARLLATERVVVVPIVNIDGTIATKQAFDPVDQTGVDPEGLLSTVEIIGGFGGFNAYRRKNCDGEIFPAETPCELTWGVDNNRNYGNAWGGPGSSPDVSSQSYHGPGPRSEPETQAVWNFARTHHVTTLMTLHTVAALVLRPPGLHDGGLAPDEARMKEIGDKMGDVAGYTSQFSWQLYDTAGTTEDDTYAATGGYGYTIEMGPPNGNFHEAYETGVVKEWTGDNDHAKGRGGLREALLIAAEAAANPADHAVVRGSAPAGKVLRLKKSFETKTSPYCSKGIEPVLNVAALPEGGICPQTSDPQTLKDTIDTTTVVPSSGSFEWHVGQSTRPFVNGGATKEETKDDPTPLAEMEGAPSDPTSEVDQEFTVPEGTVADKLRVTLTPTLPEDYDIEVFRKEADGSLKSVGTSGNIPGESEEVLIQEPAPGTYVVRVAYYAAATGAYKITVTRVVTTRTVDPGTGKEAYELTCENPDGTVLESRQLIIDRGQTVDLSLGCGQAPSTFANGSTLPKTIVASTAPKRKLRLGLRLASKKLRKGRVALLVTCPKAAKAPCRNGVVRLVGKVGGSKARTFARSPFRAAAGKSKVVRVKVGKKAMRKLAARKRLSISAVATATAGKRKLAGARKLTLRK